MHNINENNFFVEKQKILLYGAASIGIIAYDMLKEKDCEILGFIDKRAKEMDSFLGLPVYDIDEDIIQKYAMEEIIILVSVKNVFEHDNIVRELIKKGFHNILYRPLSVLNGKGKIWQIEINKAYDEVMHGELAKACNVPKTYEVDSYEFRDCSVLTEKEKSKVVMVPLNALYTDRKIKKTAWYNIHISALLPHLGLFRFLLGDNRYSPERYMDFCIRSATLSGKVKITPAWKRNVLKNRSNIFEYMNQAMELEPDFFVRNAPEGIWNEKGYFNLNSGKHRAAFFASVKKKYFPLLISEEHYEKWINKEKMTQVIDNIKERQIQTLKAPIPHPYFYLFPCESKEFYYNFLYELTYQFADSLYDEEELLFNTLKVLCICDDYGYIERHIHQMGCNLNSIPLEDERLFFNDLNELFYTPQVVEFGIWENIKYDYILYDVERNDYQLEEILALPFDNLLLIINEEDKLILKKYSEFKYDKFFSSVISGVVKSVYLLKRGS